MCSNSTLQAGVSALVEMRRHGRNHLGRLGQPKCALWALLFLFFLWLDPANLWSFTPPWHEGCLTHSTWTRRSRWLHHRRILHLDATRTHLLHGKLLIG